MRHNPRHALTRAVHALPTWAKVTIPVLFTAAVLAATTVLAAAPSSASVSMCRQSSSKLLTSRGGAVVEARNTWWLEPGCITVPGLGPAFSVSSSYRSSPSGKVVASPEIYRGCRYGGCTAQSGFPRRVRHTWHAVAIWSTRDNGAGGVHNTAFDIWFGRTSAYTGHPRGAEVMIWLNSHNLRRPYGSRVVTIDGRRWWLSTWRTCKPGTTICWNYVRYWAVRATSSVSWLRLHPFFTETERIGRLRAGWWLWSVEACYEVWSGGNGLRTTNFWARS